MSSRCQWGFQFDPQHKGRQWSYLLWRFLFRSKKGNWLTSYIFSLMWFFWCIQSVALNEDTMHIYTRMGKQNHSGKLFINYYFLHWFINLSTYMYWCQCEIPCNRIHVFIWRDCIAEVFVLVVLANDFDNSVDLDSSSTWQCADTDSGSRVNPLFCEDFDQQIGRSVCNLSSRVDIWWSYSLNISMRICVRVWKSARHLGMIRKIATTLHHDVQLHNSLYLVKISHLS